MADKGTAGRVAFHGDQIVQHWHRHAVRGVGTVGRPEVYLTRLLVVVPLSGGVQFLHEIVDVEAVALNQQVAGRLGQRDDMPWQVD